MDDQTGMQAVSQGESATQVESAEDTIAKLRAEIDELKVHAKKAFDASREVIAVSRKPYFDIPTGIYLRLFGCICLCDFNYKSYEEYEQSRAGKIR